MLARWLDRGLGQILAPDERVATRSSGEEASSSFWRIVAPDPVWEASLHGVKNENQSSKINPSERSPLPSSSEQTSKDSISEKNYFRTPSGRSALSSGNVSPLERLVIEAARGTTESILSPGYVADARNKVFRLCASSKPLQDKLLKKLKKILEQDPTLLSARASSMGNLVPDGLTPLMAAAYVNQIDAARMIVDMNPETKCHVDLQGRTALHIAAEMGSLDVIRILQSNETLGVKAPVDLLGNTPLGRAMTSHQKSARMAQTQLTQVLFSPGDPSVCGIQTPSQARSTSLPGCPIPLGYAQMPGFRVKMEDALSIHSWDGHSLVGVCDGHGDDSKVSTMIASEVKNVYLRQSSALSEHDRWSLTCLALDELVRKSGFPGGSTGIWACIKNNSIVVVNVGDCRGVLVQEDPTISTEDTQKSSLPSSLEDSVVKASDSKIMDELTEKCNQVSLDDTNPKIHSKMPFLVFPLSTDQKPDLPSERERIEGAGLTVTQESYIDEHGLKKYVPKILLAPGHSMAVARSFGDFEYKSNSNLSPEQQALIAIPEVKIHERSPRDSHLILACDGVWDVMTNEEVCEFVVTHVDKMIEDDESDVLPKVGDLLLSKCLELGSKDNMSVVIVGLSATANKVESSGLMKGKALQF